MKRDSFGGLDRFLDAQEGIYEEALNEILNGKKESHWMWFVFPQVKGLGMSFDANYYGIDGLEEAKDYLSNEVLRERLLEISGALLTLDSSNSTEILGYPDDLKLKSSMTLFLVAEPECQIFQNVLDKFYDGDKDDLTLNMIGKIW